MEGEEEVETVGLVVMVHYVEGEEGKVTTLVDREFIELAALVCLYLRKSTEVEALEVEALEVEVLEVEAE